MKKRVLTVLTALLFAFGGLSLSACTGGSTIKSISMASEDVVQVPFGNFSPEGINVDVNFTNGGKTTIPLTDDMISENEAIKFYRVGEQDIEVSFRNTFFTTMKVNVVYNTFSDIYKLEDATYTYDALPHSIRINEELPEGATVEYPRGNTFTNAGTYEVTAVISKPGYESKSFSAILKILPAEHETGDMYFNDASFTYNGEMKTVEVGNVPEGVSVVYTIYDTAVTPQIIVPRLLTVGNYRVVARFVDSNNNYAKIPDMEAKVTIGKGDYDMSGYRFMDVGKVYDGLNYDAHVSNEDKLPTRMTVRYEYYKLTDDGKEEKVIGNDNKESGTYKMVAIFENGDTFNYNPVPNKEAILTVSPVSYDLRNIVFADNRSWDYDGEAKDFSLSYVIVGNLPEQVTLDKIAYQYYEDIEKKTPFNSTDYIYAGEYPIYLDLHSNDNNMKFITDDLYSYITINKISKEISASITVTSQSGTNYANVTTTETDTVVIEDVYFYEISDPETKVDLQDLQTGHQYGYRASLAYGDPNLAKSIDISDIAGAFVF